MTIPDSLFDADLCRENSFWNLARELLDVETLQSASEKTEQEATYAGGGVL